MDINRNRCRSMALSAVLAMGIGNGFVCGQAVRQTVQLPTFHYFGVTTTVLVPDRGTVELGGVAGSSLGGPNGRGLRAFGRTSAYGGVSINATIIDHGAIDRALLAEAARRRGATVDVLGRPVQYPTPSRAPRANERVRKRMPTAGTRQAATYLRRAREAEAAGEPHAAKIFYGRVRKFGDLGQQRHAVSRLAEIDRHISSESRSR